MRDILISLPIHISPSDFILRIYNILNCPGHSAVLVTLIYPSDMILEKTSFSLIGLFALHPHPAPRAVRSLHTAAVCAKQMSLVVVINGQNKPFRSAARPRAGCLSAAGFLSSFGHIFISAKIAWRRAANLCRGGREKTPSREPGRPAANRVSGECCYRPAGCRNCLPRCCLVPRWKTRHAPGRAGCSLFSCRVSAFAKADA